MNWILNALGSIQFITLNPPQDFIKIKKLTVSRQLLFCIFVFGFVFWFLSIGFVFWYLSTNVNKNRLSVHNTLNNKPSNIPAKVLR